jgi:hypothetical protein
MNTMSFVVFIRLAPCFSVMNPIIPLYTDVYLFTPEIFRGYAQDIKIQMFTQNVKHIQAMKSNRRNKSGTKARNLVILLKGD